MNLASDPVSLKVLDDSKALLPTETGDHGPDIHHEQ